MTVPIRNILVPTDFSGSSDHALLYAASLGERYGATIHLAHVVTLGAVDRDDQAGTFPDLKPYLDRADQAARQALDKGVDHGGAAEATVERVVLRSVNAYEAIIEYAGDKGIDLIIMAMRSRSALSHVLLGSVTERVIRYAPCPVMVVEKGDRDFVDPETGAVNLQRVVVAHDFGDRSQRALGWAIGKLLPYEPEVHLVHVVETDMPKAYEEAGLKTTYSIPPEVRARLTGLLQERAAEHVPEGWTVVCEVIDGKPHKGVTGYATEHEADLLVVGTEANTNLSERIVGGTSERIVRHAPCPTLIA